MNKAPPWLAEFQKEFGAVLRTPLDHSRGTLLSELPANWTRLDIRPRSQRKAEAGLSDYHRQYWFRLLTILQKDFSLTAHLMGLWTFNLEAQRYLQEYPPQGYDLADVRKHFVRFLNKRECAAQIFQSAMLDDMRANLLMAPASRPWQWEAHHEPDQMQLHAAADWRIFREDWALVERCMQLESGMDPKKWTELKAHRATQAWLIQRDDKGLMHRPLPAAQALLYELLSEKNLEDALMYLEREVEDPNLATWVQNWMADSMRWGLWAAS